MFKGTNEKEYDEQADLAQSSSKMKEIGTTGLNAFAGMIQEAFNEELYWPGCSDLYDRLWRSDPEVTIARNVFDAMSREQTVEFKLDPQVQDPTPGDEEAVEFGNEVLADMEGGIDKFYNKAMSTVPFYGWGWWSVVPGIRKEGWRAPKSGQYPDTWSSDYDDGRVGYRRLSFRRYSSFYEWQIDEQTGRMFGMWQHDIPNKPVLLPLDASMHVTFGDSDNPEGLATFEAVWRLERIKQALEIILGIGFERSAGYVSFNAEEELTPADKALIRSAAKGVMTAQEGNYLALPDKIKASIMDVAFQSAGELLNAIRYFGILKLGLLGMQWAALGTLSPFGSYSSMADASEFFLTVYNSISEGVIKQADQQIGKRLFEYPVNKAAFPDMTRRPVLTVTQAEKTIPLNELGQLMTALNTFLPLGDDDLIAIRRKTGFMPEQLPVDVTVAALPMEPEPTEVEAEESVGTEGKPEEEEQAELARRPFVVSDDEKPTTTVQDAYVSEEDAKRAVRKWKKWASENDPDYIGLLDAELVEDETA